MPGVEVCLSRGSYALYFSQPLEIDAPFRLTFVSAAETQPAVLKESAAAKARQPYDMSASAA
jgi:hypothetical protein